MPCTQTNYTAEELRSMIRNKDFIYDISEDQTAEQTLANLKHSQDAFGVVEVDGERGYGLKGSTVIDLFHTVTKPISDLFKKRKGTKEAERISNLPDNQIKQAGGTYIHGVNEEIMRSLTEPDNAPGHKTMEQIYSQHSERLTKLQFKALINGVQEIIESINEQQNKINKKYRTTGTATILIEQVVIDPLTNEGGTMDLIAIFSDNTASIYDYKVIMPQSSRTAGYGSSATVVDEIFPEYKKEGFNMQMSRYKEIVKERYGVRTIRASRIIPVHVQYQVKKKKNRQPGAALSDTFVKVEMGAKTSKFLDQLPTGFEHTGDPGLDKLLKKQMNIIEKLKERQKQAGLREGEWGQIKERIAEMTKSVNGLIMKQDVEILLGNIGHMIENFHRRQHEPMLLEDGTANSKYLTDDDLDSLIEEFIVYADLVEYTARLLEDTKEEAKPGVYERLFGLITRATGQITLAKHEMIEKKNTRMLGGINRRYKDEYGRLKPQNPIEWVTRTFSRLSEQRHPFFKKFKQLKDEALFKVRSKTDELMEEVEEKQAALFKWAKDNKMSKTKAFEMLVNPETGNLLPKLNKAFWKEHTKAKENQDAEWFKKTYKLRDKNWKKTYEERKQRHSDFLKVRLNANSEGVFQDLVVDGVVKKTAAEYARDYASKMKLWERTNNFEKDDAWLNAESSWQATIKPEVMEANYSEEYLRVKAIKPLNDFYEMWEKRMAEMRGILGERKMGNNFIPNIRRSVFEKLQGNNFNPKESIVEMIDSLSVRQEDIYIADQDLVTGEKFKQVPVLFIEPFRDADGNIKKGEKSYDLGSVLILFGKMAYNHQYMSEIESTSLAMKDYLGSNQYEEYTLDVFGRRKKDITGNWATRTFAEGSKNKTADAFQKFLDYHLYGIRFQEKGGVVRVMGREIHSTKAFLTAKGYFSAKVLGFPVIPGMAAWMAGQTNVYFQGKKGVVFEQSHLRNARKWRFTQRKKYVALNKFFDVYAEDHSYRKALKLAKSPMTRWATMRTLFSPLRRADEDIDNDMLISMSQNYGFDIDGNLKRLKNLPEGSKSIWDLTQLDQKDMMSINGISDASFIQFRNAVRYASGGVKGSMNNEDVSLSHLSLSWDAVMHFKTWMSGFLTERAGKTHYNEDIDAMQTGRYRAMGAELFEYHKEDEDFGDFLKKTVAGGLGRIAIDIATFGLAPRMGMKRVNEARAKLAYDKWRINNEADAQNVTFDMFLEAKQAQIKAMMVEMRTILLVSSIILFMSGKSDDDDEPRYNQFYLTRMLFKIINRAQSEMAFAYNPQEFIRLMKNPVPITRIIIDAQRTINNTVDEMRDAAYGEDSPQDKRPWGYDGSQWVPGVTQARRIFEPYAQDKRNTYN